MAHSEVIDRLSEYAAPWTVSSLAISAGEWIVRNDFPHLLDRRQLFVESERLWNAIKSLPYFDPQPTDTHFFLVRFTHQR